MTILVDTHRRLTRSQAMILTAQTGVLIGGFDDFHRYAEHLLDRPVLSAEFASGSTWAQLKDASLLDFKSIQPQP